MCFLLFLEPSRCSLHAKLSRFFPPSCHLSRSCVSNLCKPLAIMSNSSTSLNLVFCLSFSLSHQLLSVVHLLGLVLYPFSSHARTIATFALSETLPITLHPSSIAPLRNSSNLITQWRNMTFQIRHAMIIIDNVTGFYYVFGCQAIK